uniref:Uncharacterized protein n=1 Tax=Arundo donax TaxID=35708 RepID=A0A0A8ZZW8_ARUDO
MAYFYLQKLSIGNCLAVSVSGLIWGLTCLNVSLFPFLAVYFILRRLQHVLYFITASFSFPSLSHNLNNSDFPRIIPLVAIDVHSTLIYFSGLCFAGWLPRSRCMCALSWLRV